MCPAKPTSRCVYQLAKTTTPSTISMEPVCAAAPVPRVPANRITPTRNSTTAAPMTRQVEGSNEWNRALRLLDPAWEHDCHEGNVVLRHMRNVYEQTWGTKPRPQTVPGSVPATAP